MSALKPITKKQRINRDMSRIRSDAIFSVKFLVSPRFLMSLSTVILVVLAASRVEAALDNRSSVPVAESSRNKEPVEYPELEVYLSFSVNRPSLKGDFDGHSFFSGAGLILLVPEVKSSLGLGAALGVKRRFGPTYKNALGAELYVVRSSHDGTWLGLPGEGVLWDVGAGLSWHFLADSRVQPYFKGSMGFTGFDFNLDDAPELDTCSFAGTKWAFGLGLSVYLTPQWFLDIGLSSDNYRFGAPADIRSIVLDPPLTTSTLDFEGRISFRF